MHGIPCTKMHTSKRNKGSQHGGISDSRMTWCVLAFAMHACSHSVKFCPRGWPTVQKRHAGRPFLWGIEARVTRLHGPVMSDAAVGTEMSCGSWAAEDPICDKVEVPNQEYLAKINFILIHSISPLYIPPSNASQLFHPPQSHYLPSSRSLSTVLLTTPCWLDLAGSASRNCRIVTLGEAKRATSYMVRCYNAAAGHCPSLTAKREIGLSTIQSTSYENTGPDPTPQLGLRAGTWFPAVLW